MVLLTNAVVISVVVLCVLCLLKVNVLISLILSSLVGALLGGIGIVEAINLMTTGFGRNGNTALAYLLLGTFASALTATGLAGIVAKKLSRIVGTKKGILLLVLAIMACLSQNLIPVHIAFIPILVPPLLSLMNELKLDRRAAACVLVWGMKTPNMMFPFGFGAVFMGLIASNITANGMPCTVSDVAHYNWILGLAMILGVLIAVFITYRKPREYRYIEVDTSRTDMISEHLTKDHYVTIAAILVVLVLQILTSSLTLSSLSGLLVMVVFGAIKLNRLDQQFAEGVKLMGLICFVMLIAGGYGEVIKATGAVSELVEAAVAMIGGNKFMAAIMINLVGLLVTMGIGSSFSTIPVISVIYVPLCQQLGFSTPATILLIAAAAALGDAGSPASDCALGPNSGLNLDGQQDLIWDTCVPTFLHFNIPLFIVASIVPLFI